MNYQPTADRGQGIRMFNSREGLYKIFQSFEDESSDEEHSDSDNGAEGNMKTAVMTSQLRHFVIQVCQACRSTNRHISDMNCRNTSAVHYW
jgi:tubulin--tyrosine ligase